MAKTHNIDGTTVTLVDELPPGISMMIGRIGRLTKKADAGELEALVDAAIANNPSEVEAVKGGNEKLLNFLTGQVMKSAATKPNPKQVTELLRAKLL